MAITMNIDELLGKYYNGETTPEEERQLKEFFANKKGHSAEGDLFGFLKTESEKELEFEINENEILSKINKKNVIKFSTFFKYAAVAAAILLIFNIFYYTVWKEMDDQTSSKKTGLIITDANIDKNRDIALNEIKNAFAHINKSQQITSENFQNLRMIRNVNNVLNIFENEQ